MNSGFDMFQNSGYVNNRNRKRTLILDVDEWILDPSNSYKKYCDGILNSGIVVENLSKPKIAISNNPIA